jgi:hypothetical protein
MKRQYIRCAEKFHKRKRYDVVLVKLPSGNFVLARLKVIFTCAAGGNIHKLARVSIFKTLSEGSSNIIGMRAVQEMNKYQFICLDWIVRSIYLEPTFDPIHMDYWYVNDILDADTYLLFLNISHNNSSFA